MATFRVTAAHLEGGQQLEHIQKIETVADIGGSKAYPTVQDVAARIDNHIDRFYTQVAGNMAWVRTNRTAAGRKFIETQRDSTGVDNLLSLPRF